MVVKPAAFAYFAPDTVDGVVEVLGSHDDVKILAGGQSLVPAMNFRLARPAVLVDINGIAELDYVDVRNGELEVGALARHSRFETPVEPGLLGTALADIARFIGHHPIRLRGTFVGSVAHADPASEWCVVASTLDATMVVLGPGGERTVEAGRFFHTLFTTDLHEDELLRAVRIPLLTGAHRVGFAEFARRAGDFALVMAMVVLQMTDGEISEARIGLGGVADKAVRASAAEAALIGMRPDAGSAEVAGRVAAESVTPLADIHGSAAYRIDLIRAMVRRAATKALTP